MTEIDQMDQAATSIGDNRFIEARWFHQIDGVYRLMGSACNTCGKVSFPIKPFCPSCFSDDQEQVPLSNTGTLHTFSQSVMGPRDMERPYIIGFIDLPEGIKLYSILTDCDPWDQVLKIDMKMRMKIGKIKSDEAGNDVLGYCFTPIFEKEALR